MILEGVALALRFLSQDSSYTELHQPCTSEPNETVMVRADAQLVPCTPRGECCDCPHVTAGRLALAHRPGRRVCRSVPLLWL